MADETPDQKEVDEELKAIALKHKISIMVNGKVYGGDPINRSMVAKMKRLLNLLDFYKHQSAESRLRLLREEIENIRREALKNPLDEAENLKVRNAWLEENYKILKRRNEELQNLLKRSGRRPPPSGRRERGENPIGDTPWEALPL